MSRYRNETERAYPGGRWGPRRARVGQCLVLRAEDIHQRIVLDGQGSRPGWSWDGQSCRARLPFRRLASRLRSAPSPDLARRPGVLSLRLLRSPGDPDAPAARRRRTALSPVLGPELREPEMELPRRLVGTAPQLQHDTASTRVAARGGAAAVREAAPVPHRRCVSAMVRAPSRGFAEPIPGACAVGFLSIDNPPRGRAGTARPIRGFCGPTGMRFNRTTSSV